MAQRSMNTQTEILGKINGLISEAKLAPDADIPFLIGLETQIITKMREPFEAAAGQMGAPPGNSVDMGAGMADAAMAVMPGGGGGSPMGAPGPGGPMPASIPGGAMRQSPDMMRRALGGMGVQGG